MPTIRHASPSSIGFVSDGNGGVVPNPLWARVGAADFLSEDEKREAVGYGARDGG